MTTIHLGTSRRQFIAASAAAIGTSLLPHVISAETATAATTAQPDAQRNSYAYHFAIGDIEAWSISDGNLALNEGLDLMWPIAERPAMKSEMIAHGERTDVLPLYVNILVLKAGNEIVLFDSGFGPGKNPNSGWVGDALTSVGIMPDKVTHTFLSHAHSDHIGGFVAGNKQIFPNAALHCTKEEVDFWRSPNPDFSRSKRDKGPLAGMVRDARNKFDILEPNFQLVKPGDSLLGGAVTVIAGPGHTTGHALFRVKSGRESLMHFMDVAHHHVLMFSDPNWGIAFDHEPEIAIDTRKKIFSELATTHERAYGFHLPWPGLGRVARAGTGYEWQPERWSWGV